LEKQSCAGTNVPAAAKPKTTKNAVFPGTKSGLLANLAAQIAPAAVTG
jgi:hypothetical protein